ncbi:MAG TPA: transglycosylase SLT domain-containing protein [Stellaceae bacterium]|jgi:soluble lytic murein transglycosylase-like protein
MIKPADLLPIIQCEAPDFDPALILGFVQTESSFNERAFRIDRNGGSYGLMQLDLSTARDRGYPGDAFGLYDPKTNIHYGVAQLRWINRYLASYSAVGLQSMIAAYNEGVGRVVKGNPDPRYVASVIASRDRFRAILHEGVA